MRLLDLFSGIGGFSLAAQWVWGNELEIVAFVECDKFCQKVLHKHWPDVPIIEDVRDVTEKTLADRNKSRSQRWDSEILQECSGQQFIGSCNSSIDLLTGGFPCQPFSVAGKRKGKEDNRFLWREMFAVIKEVRPRWIIAENVAGIVRMALDDCLSDLEGEGYSTQAVIIPACAVNAPHRRDRVWIVAYTKEFRDSSISYHEECSKYSQSKGQFRRNCLRENGTANNWQSEPNVGRVVDGLSKKLDGGRLSEALRMVWEEINSASLEEWCIGQHIQESEILQFQMLREMVDKQKLKSNNSGNSQERSTGNRSKNMSRMWSDGECSKASREQEISRHLLSEMPHEERNGEWNMGNPWFQEPNIPRVAKGVKERVNRLKSLGNAIVPQVAQMIMEAIQEVEG